MGEMALLRYKYKTKDDVEKWSELVPTSIGAIESIPDQFSTFKWVHRTSKRFGAWV